MKDIYNKGLSDKILKEFPGLGHTRDGVKEFVIHDVAGTRQTRKNVGQSEIEGKWELDRGLL
jgi:hypothetical protein